MILQFDSITSNLQVVQLSSSLKMKKLNRNQYIRYIDQKQMQVVSAMKKIFEPLFELSIGLFWGTDFEKKW